MRRILLILALIIGGLALTVVWLTQDGEERDLGASVTVAEALDGDLAGFKQATGEETLSFPDDYGPHPEYANEWWYYTGHLLTEEGQRFGYQFTLFRIGLTPPDTVEAVTETATSDWATDHFFMGHLALSDIENETHYASERYSRGGAGLAGAQARPFRAWLDDWSVDGLGGDDVYPMHIQAADEAISLDLMLDPKKPRVLQGEDGFSTKGPGEGNASYYFSQTRLDTAGDIVVHGDTMAVEGLSWMDREWHTNVLGEEQIGWDWFSVQLDDGRDLMYFEVRQADDAPPYTDGTVVEEDGTTHRVTDAELEVLDTWESPRGGTYPVQWQLQVPEHDLDLTITPYFEDQEMDVSVRYYEGAVDVEGTSEGVSVTGQGFVELTGYGDEEQDPFSG